MQSGDSGDPTMRYFEQRFLSQLEDLQRHMSFSLPHSEKNLISIYAQKILADEGFALQHRLATLDDALASLEQMDCHTALVRIALLSQLPWQHWDILNPHNAPAQHRPEVQRIFQRLVQLILNQTSRVELHDLLGRSSSAGVSGPADLLLRPLILLHQLRGRGYSVFSAQSRLIRRLWEASSALTDPERRCLLFLHLTFLRGLVSEIWNGKDSQSAQKRELCRDESLGVGALFEQTQSLLLLEEQDRQEEASAVVSEADLFNSAFYLHSLFALQCMEEKLSPREEGLEPSEEVVELLPPLLRDCCQLMQSSPTIAAVCFQSAPWLKNVEGEWRKELLDVFLVSTISSGVGADVLGAASKVFDPIPNASSTIVKGLHSRLLPKTAEDKSRERAEDFVLAGRWLHSDPCLDLFGTESGVAVARRALAVCLDEESFGEFPGYGVEMMYRLAVRSADVDGLWLFFARHRRLFQAAKSRLSTLYASRHLLRQLSSEQAICLYALDCWIGLTAPVHFPRLPKHAFHLILPSPKPSSLYQLPHFHSFPHPANTKKLLADIAPSLRFHLTNLLPHSPRLVMLEDYREGVDDLQLVVSPDEFRAPQHRLVDSKSRLLLLLAESCCDEMGRAGAAAVAERTLLERLGWEVSYLPLFHAPPTPSFISSTPDPHPHPHSPPEGRIGRRTRLSDL